ncbi:ISL3 family transposase (plasmid) [Clostridium perfringens]|nr:ISL3 family transposase [Clostridium perfringens]MBI6024457.1 ISL3 family transposase [Clostridium perfringens]MBI6024458.1 ISL3 family transposase [Clostridium perfringens]MBI6048555.1 ISL3 family transposase [Clostridium perfringens]MBI6048560.1 ISL3 family transposase [Clostridium perfringens]MDK0872674.1 ISL3 family transposase [Clostridium perfringens]
MHIKDINKLLNLQDINIVKISDVYENSVEIILEPLNYIQNCPCCNNRNVIRKGSSGYRKVRHLPLCGNKTFLLLPKIRLYCKDCLINFTFKYSFINGKSRYTNQYNDNLANAVTGSTVAHASEFTGTPYSTVERIFKNYLNNVKPKICAEALKLSKNTERLIIGIDDFAIRKGHSYNTGIHDLRNETLLHLVKGRKLNELREDKEKNPAVYDIQPVAVVMDLAQYYHKFAEETFPKAVRIADRFHVNRYALDALQDVRRRVSSGLSSQNRSFLKCNKNLLSKRNDQLNENEIIILKKVLSLSLELKKVYWWKENLIEWYDCCTNFNQATIVFDKWLYSGRLLNIPEVNIALKTFENWKQEIINYHLYRFTNAPVEGRNNKIKAIQRRHYFTRNRDYYEARIFLECNKRALTA